MVLLLSIAEGEDKSSPFVNCIRNNYRHLRKWAKRTATDCFRIYDRDVPRYPFAIDYYAGRFCVHYFATKQADEPPSDSIAEVNHALCKIFGIDSDAIFWRTRSRTKGETRQYDKLGGSREFFEVYEYGLKFWVNLVDYLDTGLFLDHRETRKLVAGESKGKRVLNLFAYTCSFSVHAAAAGAQHTKSVDMSNTYTAWGRENFVLNGFSEANNSIVRADCLRFLDDEIRSQTRYDIIVVDPPTISRSKKMSGMFDIQEDYITLLSKALRLLVPGGVLFFSTNARKFAFDESQFKECTIADISAKTLPIDFRDPKIHRCWRIQKPKK